MSRKPVVIDLFCGAGGMSLGFELGGFEIGMGIDSDKFACETHNLNFQGRCHNTQIEHIEDPRTLLAESGYNSFDVVVGGPPCQGFSRVGRGKIRSLQEDPTDEIDDPRNQYYRHFIRFVKTLKPLFFVMENVPDMRTYKDGERLLLDKAIEEFRKSDYEVEFKILQADHYGVPQTRRRLFLVGNRLDLPIVWPEETHSDEPRTVWDAISDLPIVAHGAREQIMSYEARCDLNEYQEFMREGAGSKVTGHQTRWHNDQDLEAFRWMPEGGKYIDLPDRFKRYRDDIFQDKYRKLLRDEPSWTVEAHLAKDCYRHIYPSRENEPEPPRTISAREAARLQSFPDRFQFAGAMTRQFHQIGNAVPPLLAKAIAKTIKPQILANL